MKLVDNLAVKQIIGGLMHNTLLLLEYTDITRDDFESKVARVCFGSIENLYKQGATTITVLELEDEILKLEGVAAAIYKEGDGLRFLKVCYEIAELSNFDLYYKRLKKLSLLICLQKAHYDISDYFKEDKDIKNPLEEAEIKQRFDDATLEDILNNVENKYAEIRNNYLNGGKKKGDVADGIFELIEDFRKNPDNGPMLEGDLYSYVVRGARKGKFYLKSSSSGTGKTRTYVFDACRLAYPIRYSNEKATFIREISSDWKPIKPRKVLFIVTEMDKSEIQTMILAYLSGVNEEHIITNKYDLGELERVSFAATIMKKYSGYFIVEEISDPNLVNVEATIKKYAMIDKVKYVAFDYIHTTNSLMNQFSRSGLREDVALMLLSNQLKQLAKDYNLFILSATQVNMNAMDNDGNFKNEMSIRGSKAVSDKCDVGLVMTRVTDKLWENLIGDFRKSAREGYIQSEYLENRENRPTHILDVYKNRRGRLKDIRIWTRLNLGTGERKDLFITNADNYPIMIPDDTLYKTNTEIINWRDMLEKGVIE